MEVVGRERGLGFHREKSGSEQILWDELDFSIPKLAKLEAQMSGQSNDPRNSV